MSKIDDLPLDVYTLRDLRVAAKVALVCGDNALAQQLRELHDTRKFVDPQPDPVDTEHSEEVTVPEEKRFPRASRLLQERKAFGLRKYGTPLKTNNGRDPRIDEIQELLDACNYAQQAGMEDRFYRTYSPYSRIELYMKLIEALACDFDKEDSL